MAEEIRLNKYLSEIGVCSRREADRLIESGKVSINGETAKMGIKVTGKEEILMNGRKIKQEKPEEMVLIAVNKPRGIVCTTAKEDKNNIVDFINYPTRIYPIGRLDKDSEGLILMTNNGEIVNKILRSRNNHEKEYVVTVDKTITEQFLKRMSQPIPILDTMTKPCKIWKTGQKEFHIILTQGLNRQIRRMCEYCGYKVMKLERIRIMNIGLGNLKTGGYRNITKQEIIELRKQL